MDAKRLLLSLTIFAMLSLGACRSDTNARGPAMSLQLDARKSSLPLEDCRALNLEYLAALQEARACDPAIQPKQCTLLAVLSLECGCFDYVNTRNKEAVAKMRTASRAWEAGGCSDHLYACQGVLCRIAEADDCIAVNPEDRPEPHGGVCAF
jgi:hypothetical protein